MRNQLYINGSWSPPLVMLAEVLRAHLNAHHNVVAPAEMNVVMNGVAAVVETQCPLEAAIEETFVNVNPGSTLKLGQARGVVLLAPARAGLPVFEYAANLVKKSVTGAGHADKRQIAMMVGRLLPGVDASADAADAPSPDHAADAFAVAICHAHHRATAKRVEAAL